jgi:plasmid stability protein
VQRLRGSCVKQLRIKASPHHRGADAQWRPDSTS